MTEQFRLNPLHCADAYKLGHRNFYSPGLTKIASNLTPRSTKNFPYKGVFYDNQIVAFGAQAVAKELSLLWKEEFFDRNVDEVVPEYVARVTPFSGSVPVTADHVRELHSLQYLPIQIKALPDGTKVNPGTPVCLFESTDDRFPWLTNYIEDYVSNQYWKMSTVATIASVYRRMLVEYAKATGTPVEFVNWQAHDFSERGMSCMLDAARSGSGHLTSFLGTDTMPAADYVDWAYRGKECFVGGSVPATEHSIMTLDGPQGEAQLIERLIRKVDTGVLSLVLDGFDYWDAITNKIPSLKELIMSRKPDANGLAKVVIRPDSGDPVRIICGYDEYEIDRLDDGRILLNDGKFQTTYLTEDEVKGSVRILWEHFGGTITSTGHKMLDSHIGLIYGDSITMDRCEAILERLDDMGFASGNVVFGVGSYTYQYLTRDTLGYAMKATYGIVNGEERAIFKDPKTGDGTKKSARGLLKVVDVGGVPSLMQFDTKAQYDADKNPDMMIVVFENSRYDQSQTIDDVRKRIDPDWKI